MFYVTLRTVRLSSKGLMFCLWNPNNNRRFIVVMIFKPTSNENLEFDLEFNFFFQFDYFWEVIFIIKLKNLDMPIGMVEEINIAHF